MSDPLILVWLCPRHTDNSHSFIHYKAFYSKDSVLPEHTADAGEWLFVYFTDVNRISAHGIWRAELEEKCLDVMAFLGAGRASLLERPALSRNLILKAIDAGRVEL